MIEIFIQDRLREVLGDIVSQEKPDPISQRFVVLDKTGSGTKNHLKSTTIAFQSYAESKYQAAMLNEKVKELVEGLIAYDEISKVELNSDYPFPDTTTKQYRYQAVFDIYHY